MARMPVGRTQRAAALVLPGGLIVGLAFSSGGYYPGATALAATAMALLLLARVLLGEQPFRGAGLPLALVAGALALFAVWTLLSPLWSNAPARALIEFDRVLLYLLALLLFASWPRSATSPALLLRSLAAGAVAVCVVGLLTRTLPDLLTIAPAVQKERLSYPIGYWNALGLLAALGCLTCLHLSSCRDEPRAIRVLAAAALPTLAATLFFTFSRGPLAALAVGLLVYALVARPRLWFGAALAIVPSSALALAISYDAELLASKDPTTAAAAAQGHWVLIGVVLCTGLAAGLRLLLTRHEPRPPRVSLGRRGLAYAAGAALIAVTATAAVAGPSAWGELRDQYQRTVRPDVRQTGDYRDRFTDPGLARLDLWGVAIDAFRAAPLHGQGAGTYEVVWAEQRPADYLSVDAHSLVLEVPAELGLVGLLLLAGGSVALLVVLVGRVRDDERGLYGAVLALFAVWGVHAGVDWDWEVPAVTLWLFMAAGCVVAGSGTAAPARAGPSRAVRVAMGLGCLALLASPVQIARSQAHLLESLGAYRDGDCTRAAKEARESLASLDERPQPHAVLAYCALRERRPQAAIERMERAVSLDPRDWELRYGLAIVRASGGRDPRPAARAALRLNPREAAAQRAVRQLDGEDPRAWRRGAARLGILAPKG